MACVSEGKMRAAERVMNDPLGKFSAQPLMNTRAINKVQRQIERDTATIESAIDYINKQLSQNPVPPNTPGTSQAVSREAYSAANGMVDPTKSREAMVNLLKKQGNLQDYLSTAASVGKKGVLMTMSQWLTGKFIRQAAPYEAWALLWGGGEGKMSGDNPIVRAGRSLSSSVTGQMTSFQQNLVKPFLDTLKPLAERLGLDVEEVARDVGMWANANHVAERYDYIIDRANKELETRLRDLTAKQGTLSVDQLHQEAAVIASMQNSLETLQAARYMEKPVDDKGKRLPTVGMSEAEAEKWKRDYMDANGVSAEEMDTLADGLVNMYHAVQEWRAENGLFDEATIRSLPQGFKRFVPFATTAENANGTSVDANVYWVSNLHRMEGMTKGQLADAFSSIYRYMQRTASEAGSKDMGLALNAMYMNGLHTGIDNGVRRESYSDWARKLTSDDSRTSHAAYRKLEGEDGFTLVASMPVTDAATGETRLEKYIYYFDPLWQGKDATGKTVLTGAQISESLGKIKQMPTFLAHVANGTSHLASLNTKWTPTFPMLNMPRDAGERATSLYTQSHELENGRRMSLGLGQIAFGYTAALAKASKALVGIMRGTLDLENTAVGQAWKDYVRLGIKQEFDPAFSGRNETDLTDPIKLREERMARELAKPRYAALRNALAVAGVPVQRVSNMLSRWSEYWNNVAPFAQYLFLRNLGVTKASARESTMSVMNLRESGTATNYLRALYPFAKPTLQSGANLMRSMGLAPNAQGKFRPNMKGVAMLAAQTVAFAGLKGLIAASMGEEEYDKLSIQELARFIPIKTEDGVAKLLLPFGMTPIAATIANSIDRMLRGKMFPQDAAAEIMVSMARAVQPAEWPLFSVTTNPSQAIMQLVTPSLLLPVEQTAANTNAFGGPIDYAGTDKDMYQALQGQPRTPQMWHQVAKAAAPYVDMTPERWKHFVEGYLQGPLRVISSFVNSESVNSMGFDKTTQGELGPWGTALGATMLWKKLPEGHASQFFAAKDMIDRKVKATGVDVHDTTQYKNTEERYAYLEDVLQQKGMDQEDIDTYLRFQRAMTARRKASRELGNYIKSGEFLEAPDPKEALRPMYEDWQDAVEEIYREALGI